MYYIFLLANFAQHFIPLMKYTAERPLIILALLNQNFKLAKIKDSLNAGIYESICVLLE